MTETTFLHIQGREDSPARILELPIGPIRIGRGPHCEVRLGEPDLGDVQCLLRRRGNSWHFQPVGPPGHVWIEGRPADQQRPLPLGVPIQVGDHWLTLRSAENAPDGWGSFASPIPVEPRTSAPTSPRPDDRPRASTTPDDADERLRRWHSRLEQREQWTKDRQDERRWEARWKAASETIRARAAQPAPTPPAPPRTSPPPPPPEPRPTRPSPVSRTVEPRPASPFHRTAEPPRAPASRVPLRPTSTPSTAPPVPTSRTFEAPIARIVPPPIPTTKALVVLPVPPVNWSGAKVEPIESPGPDPVPVAETPAPEAGPVALVEPSEAKPPIPEPPTDLVPEISEIVEEPATLGRPEVEEVELAEPVVAEVPDEPEAVEPAVTDAVAMVAPVEPTAWPALESVPEPIEARFAPAQAEPTISPAPRPESGSEESPDEVHPARSRADWPSARAIFEAQVDRRQAPITESAGARRTRRAGPSPTDSMAPDQWTLPLWLGWLPTVAAALIAGLVGVALSYEWMIDASAAEGAIRAALRADGSPAPSIAPTSLPRGGWWRSTASHLSAWAMAMERSGDGEDHSGEVRSLVEAARHASPLSAGTRFAIEPTARPEGDPSPDIAHLGRSRDVISLSWAGHRLRQSGKVNASLRAYRSALAIAARTDRGDLDPPAFDEDPQVRRYALPRESILGGVARDMARSGEWTHQQWVEALPATAVASLAASRVLLKANDRAEADRLADLAIAQADASTPVDLDAAEHRAAVAEALAYRGRWTDAAQQYRRALDQVADDTTRRAWWLNLAEVLQRVGDDAGRSRAIEAARAPDAIDEITKRALRYQQGLVITPSRPPSRD